MKGEEWYQSDDVAESYDQKRFSQGGELIDRREKRAVLDTLVPVDGREILEIACGTGRFTTMLAERGADIVGLDISEPMLQQGRDRACSTGVDGGLSFLRGDAERLPFRDDRFDAVLAMRFFHLADTPETFLAEMRRVSRGQVVFDTFNRRSMRVLYNWALPMGSNLYTANDVRWWLHDAGLELADVEHDWVIPYGFFRAVPSPVASGFRQLDRVVGDTRVGTRLASVSYWDARVPGR